MGCHALLQGIFSTQGSNPGLLHRRRILHHQGECTLAPVPLSHESLPALLGVKTRHSLHFESETGGQSLLMPTQSSAPVSVSPGSHRLCEQRSPHSGAAQQNFPNLALFCRREADGHTTGASSWLFLCFLRIPFSCMPFFWADLGPMLLSSWAVSPGLAGAGGRTR